MIKSEAQKLKDNGIAIIPLFPNAKKNHDTDILTKEYKVSEVQPNGNLGVNLKQSDMYCIDPDTDWAIKFGEMWLQRNTRIGGRINNGKKELTKFFYKSDGSLQHNIKDRKDSSGETIAELFCDHNIVVYGSTPNKETQRPMKRYWESESQLAPFNQSILDTYNLICLAAAIAPHLKSANTGCLKLDSCFMRYCEDWSDEKREQVLLDICKVAMPDNKEATPQKMRRHIRANNKKVKNVGYKAFADYIGVDRLLVKNWFGWIGNVPQDPKYQRIKSYRDFVSTDIGMKGLMKKIFPEMNHAIKPILPEGVVIWAGRPKAMKSFTALKCVYAVQNGVEFLGHKTNKGDCLYLAREDSPRRLKDRTIKLGLDKLPEHPHVNTESPYLGYGLEESLQDWIDEVKNPRLIIIDTLARVKYRVPKGGTTFDLDNELLRDIQTLAITNGITIVFISHLGKAEQDYSWDRIQGSVGMQGISDAMWMIDRGDTSDTASIVGRGRDIMDFEYAVKWEAASWSYVYEGLLPEIKKTESRNEILVALRKLKIDGKQEARPRDVINHYHYAHNSKDARRIAKTMQRMENDFEIMRGDNHGFYKLIENDEDPPFVKEKIDFEKDKIN